MKILGIISPKPSLVNCSDLITITPKFQCSYPLNEKIFKSGIRSTDDINGKGIVVKFDSRKGEIQISRDIVGISPFYYSYNSDYFIFSDDLSALINNSSSQKSRNLDEIGRFLLFGEIDKSKDTLIEGINELQQGEIMTFNIQKHQFEILKSGASFSICKFTDYDEIVRENKKQVEEYISLRLKANKQENQAVLLSGGLDSSIIATLLSDKLDPRNLSFLTHVLDDKSLDESSYAEMISNRYGKIPWKTVQTDSSSFIQDVEELHKIIEWPTRSIGTYNQYQLLKECASLNKKVVWDGLGADALYGGHDSYRYDLIIETLKQLRILAAYGILKWKGETYKELVSLMKYRLKVGLIKRPWLHRHFLKFKDELKIYNQSFLRQALNSPRIRTQPSLKSKMKNDFFEGGIRHLSRFTDRLGSHFGLDLIYSFAENIKWAREISSLPRDLIFRNGVPKAILRDSFKSDLPSGIYNRKDKKGLPSLNNLWIDDHKDHWIKYFTNDLSEIYDVDFIHDHYKKWWSIKNCSENYSHFNHISFAIWNKVWMLNNSDD